MHLYLFFSSSVMEAVQTLEHCLAATMDWMRAKRLKLNPDKTEVILLAGNPDQLDGLDGSGVKSGCASGPGSLNGKSAVGWSAFYRLRQIAHIQPCPDEKSLITLVHAPIISRTDYCSALYVGLPLMAVRKVQQV